MYITYYRKLNNGLFAVIPIDRLLITCVLIDSKHFIIFYYISSSFYYLLKFNESESAHVNFDKKDNAFLLRFFIKI